MIFRALRTVGLLAFAACAHTNYFNGHEYRQGDVDYQVGPIPSTWRKIEVSDANLAFRDDTNRASILVNGRCGYLDKDTPLRSLTDQLIMGTTTREFVSQEVEPFDEREAMHTVLTAKLDGVLMKYEIYVTKKDGCTYDFVYVSDPETFANGSPGFQQFVAGFHTLSGARS